MLTVLESERRNGVERDGWMEEAETVTSHETRKGVVASTRFGPKKVPYETGA